MPGELAPKVALSFIHSDPQPVWMRTTSPGRMSTFWRCRAPVRSATVMAYGACRRGTPLNFATSMSTPRVTMAPTFSTPSFFKPSAAAKSDFRLPL